jgi:hypothetical protein
VPDEPELTRATDGEHEEERDRAAGAVRFVAIFITVESGVPAGNSSGSRGSCRLQGKVLPFDGVG